MGSGVHAVVLAAASAALPFTPPPGFVQLPSSAVNVQVTNVWSTSPKPGRRPSAFSTMTMPFPGSVAGISQAMKAHAKHGPIHVLSNVPVRICGVSGRLITMRTGSGASAGIVQQEVVEKNNRGYMLAYTRPSGTPADKRIAAVMRSFCPTKENAIPKLAPPPGWIVRPTLESLGMWMGTNPGEMMVLARTAQTVPLDKLATQLQSPGKSMAAMKKYLQIVSEKSARLCGNPAVFVTMKVNVPAFPMTIEQVVTQAKGVSYLLNYMHPTSLTPSAAVEQSLRSLCASPGAAPSATPAVTQSATPAVTQSATPSPVPAGTPAPAKGPTR